MRYGERLAEIGAIPSIGSIGDSFDNALAEGPAIAIGTGGRIDWHAAA